MSQYTLIENTPPSGGYGGGACGRIFTLVTPHGEAVKLTQTSENIFTGTAPTIGAGGLRHPGVLTVIWQGASS